MTLRSPETIVLGDVDRTLHGARFLIDDVVHDDAVLLLTGRVEGGFRNSRHTSRRHVRIEARNVTDVQIEDHTDTGVIFLDEFAIENSKAWHISDPTFGGIFVKSPIDDLQFVWDTHPYEFRRWFRWVPNPVV